MSPAAAGSGVEVARLRPGRRLWTFPGAASQAPHVLLWHGSGSCESDVLAPLAARVAARGPTVHVPDWDFSSADRGRSDLLASLDHVRAQTDSLVLAGWSMGGVAAAGAAVSMPDLPLRAVVGLAGGLAGREPLTDARPVEVLESWPADVACLLVHGIDDDVVPVQESRDFAAALTVSGVGVTLTEVAGGHAAVVLSAYDPAVARCLPSAEPDVQAAGAVSVRLLLEAAGPFT